jgi:hypothetical protein
VRQTTGAFICQDGGGCSGPGRAYEEEPSWQ